MAIVKKIMEDHNGDLVLEDREEGGARVALVFHPIKMDLAEEEEAEEVALDPLKVATGTLAHGV